MKSVRGKFKSLKGTVKLFLRFLYLYAMVFAFFSQSLKNL